MANTPDDQAALATMRDRLRIMLPEDYQDHYEEVQPVSMGSAGLKFAGDGRVAWDEMWESFCDLAMAGGPPHKGQLLEPASRAEVEAEPERYRQVVAEICRGIRLVTGLDVHASPAPGWVRITCLDEAMAQWFLRAIVIENVSVRAEGVRLELPAGPRFRIEKEIKNVVTVSAKTAHYWLGHTSRYKQRAIARLFAAMAAESPLLEPETASDAFSADANAVLAQRMAEAIQRETGLVVSSRRYLGWLGVECPTVAAAIWMMRAMLVNNVLARREDTLLFVPVNTTTDPGGSRLVSALARVYRLASSTPGVW
jgi:sirohydrochlorin cobaltochelatase